MYGEGLRPVCQGVHVTYFLFPPNLNVLAQLKLIATIAQSHFFKIKIKDSGAINFSFFMMNNYVERGTDGGYVPKCTVAYFQGRRSEISTFCVPNCS